MYTFILYIVITPLLLTALLILNFLISMNKPDFSKLSPYECGMDTIGTAREKFNIQFYLVAILYLVFDIEVIFLFPFASVLYDISIFGFWISIIFILILTIGFMYELSKDILNFIKK
jgi:NADH:ubiquinone oxidoreductase subunit 3 (subunit A)